MVPGRATAKNPPSRSAEISWWSERLITLSACAQVAWGESALRSGLVKVQAPSAKRCTWIFGVQATASKECKPGRRGDHQCSLDLLDVSDGL